MILNKSVFSTSSVLLVEFLCLAAGLTRWRDRNTHRLPGIRKDRSDHFTFLEFCETLRKKSIHNVYYTFLLFFINTPLFKLIKPKYWRIKIESCLMQPGLNDQYDFRIRKNTWTRSPRNKQPRLGSTAFANVSSPRRSSDPKGSCSSNCAWVCQVGRN